METEMETMKCEMPDKNPPCEEVVKILETHKKIAVVGCSPKAWRDSHKVAKYLLEKGYEVVPVNPGQREILGKTCYKSLRDIPCGVEVVDIFLNPKRVPPVVEEAIEIDAKVVWMQLGVVENVSAGKARENGLQVVMNRCIKEEHRKMPPRK